MAKFGLAFGETSAGVQVPLKVDAQGRVLTSGGGGGGGGGVPTTREINGHPLSSDVTLTADDVGAASREDFVSLRARGDELIRNGKGSEGDNSNWPDMTYVPGDAPLGSFGHFTVGRTGRSTNPSEDFLAVDPTGLYECQLYVKQMAQDVTEARVYYGVRPYDAFGNIIGAYNFNTATPDVTTFAQPVANGDTTVHLTSGVGWDATRAPTHQRGFIVWDYTDGNGHKWGAGEYSRIVDTGMFAAQDFSSGVISLSRPWALGSFPAGTEVSRSSSGDAMHFVFNVLGDFRGGWTRLRGSLGGGVLPPFRGFDNRHLPTATATIEINVLLNYNAQSPDSKSELAVSNISLRRVDGSAESVAMSLEAADSAQINRIKAVLGI